MSLEHAILGFLRYGPLTGYDLKTRCFDRLAAHIWSADQSQIYRTLERLESQRLVRAKRERQTGRPDRHAYTLTDKGHGALVDWVREPHGMPPHRDPFLMQIAVAGDLDASAVRALLLERREAHQKRLESTRRRVAGADGDALPGAMDRVLLGLTLDAAAAADRAAIDWIDDSIELLDAKSREMSQTVVEGSTA